MSATQHVCLLFNALVLPADHPDYESEAGVLGSVSALGSSLRAAGYRTSELAAGDCSVRLAQQLSDLRPDVVVNFCESFAGNSAGEAHVAALLEMFGLPYTGSPPECLALALDKAHTKRILAGAGVPTAPFVEVPRGQTPPEAPLRGWLERGPLFVKPSREDASLGVGQESVVVDWEALLRQVAAVHQRYGDVLVERYIHGREYNVGVIELPEFQVLPVAETEFHEHPDLRWPIVTYDGKWATNSCQSVATPVTCPADIEPALAQQLSSAAAAAYRLTGCRDYARIDLRVDDAGNPFVLEVNANPDAGPEEGVAWMLEKVGISYDEFARRLVETAAARGKKRCKAGDGIAAAALNKHSAAGRARREAPPITIRPLRAGEQPVLLEIARACQVFRAEELEVAAEVLGEAALDDPAGDYQVLVAQAAGRIVGWSCHGRVPLTDAAFDLYWIAVDPQLQGEGIGGRLLAEVEQQVTAGGGRWLLAETSSIPAYDSTRAFYLRCGYRVVTQLDDFYRPGDGLVTFAKRFTT